MELKEILLELEEHSDEATKAVYQRQGAGDNVLGVNFNHLNRLKKRIKGFNTKLGLELWQSGILDAQSLATMIIDPDEVKKEELDAMAKELSFHQLCDIFVNNIVSKTSYMKDLFHSWIQSENIYTKRAAWQVLSKIAIQDESLNNAFFLEYIEYIQENIRKVDIVLRESMNTCLIAIGIRNDELEKEVFDAEEKIGKLFNENTIFSFRFPSPSMYIQKMKEIKNLGERPY